MTVLRWQIYDPSDDDPDTNTYVFPRNPAEMSSIYQDRTISTLPTTAGKILLWEGARNAKQFTFGGPVLEKSHFDALRTWVYRRRRLVITDHFGRQITCVLTNIDLVPKRRLNVYYSHDYTVTGLMLEVTPPSVPNSGPA